MEDETGAGLVAYGFDSDPRYQREPRPRWAGRSRHRNEQRYLDGHALRHLTDDPEDAE